MCWAANEVKGVKSKCDVCGSMYFDSFLYVWHLLQWREDAEKAVQPRSTGNVKLRFMFSPAVIECITWQMKSRELKLSEMCMATHIPTAFCMSGTSHGVEKTVEGGTSPHLYNANEME